MTIYWTGDDHGLGQLALDILSETIPRLRTFIPGVEVQPFRLYIYPSSADLRSALRLTGRDWVGAHADPELGVILVTAVNQRTAATDLRQSIPHEVAHFMLYQAVGSNYGSLPMWFNEGVATHVESITNPGYQIALQTEIARQTTIPFSELCYQFPAMEERALLAYAQSESMISFIQDKYGNQKLRDMILSFADGADCQSGVSRELQTTLSELDEDWLRSQQPQSPIVQVLSEHGLWLLLFIGGIAIIQLLVLKPVSNRDM